MPATVCLIDKGQKSLKEMENPQLKPSSAEGQCHKPAGDLLIQNKVAIVRMMFGWCCQLTPPLLL